MVVTQTPSESSGRDGTTSEQINFVGDGVLSRNTTQFGSFFQDKWTINDRLTLEYGLRLDRDNLPMNTTFLPVWLLFYPIRDGRTVDVASQSYL
jgi:outer membrane receptor protein involved in Fe transport